MAPRFGPRTDLREHFTGACVAELDAVEDHRATMSRLLADAVFLLHLGFIVFAMFGAVVWLRWRWAPLLHLPALTWGASIAIRGGVCPLTPLENALREAAGEPGYTGPFIDHYLIPLVYPPGLTPTTQAGLGVGLLMLNAVLYGFVWTRRERQRRVRARASETHRPA